MVRSHLVEVALPAGTFHRQGILPRHRLAYQSSQRQIDCGTLGMQPITPQRTNSFSPAVVWPENWENVEQDPSFGYSTLGWAAMWKSLPNVVFSPTLSALRGNARLASTSLTEEIERFKAEPGNGDIAVGGATLAADIAIGGATLAAGAAAADLIDEYRLATDRHS